MTAADKPAGGLPAQGTLFLVPTPIGNFGDMTPRAVEVLRGAAIVAAEDTRKARTLLRAFGVNARLLSYYDFNERSRSPELLAALAGGQDVAVITDAGTPLVNDPGYRIVADAIAAGARVSPLPGPSAALTALIGSGLPANRFCYLGFLPRKPEARRAVIETVAARPDTMIVFEAPHRLLATLADLREVLGDRQAALARNLTKRDEEYLRGPLSAVTEELAGRGGVRGEYTVLVAGAPERDTTAAEDLAATLAGVLAGHGLAPHALRDIIKEVTGLPRNRVYELVQQTAAGSAAQDER